MLVLSLNYVCSSNKSIKCENIRVIYLINSWQRYLMVVVTICG